MRIKGESIIVLPEMIEKKFGADGLRKWLDALASEARTVFENKISPYDWFDLDRIYLDPVEKICELFYNGNHQGAFDAGWFDADQALGGIYRIFIRLGSVHFIMRRASVLFSSYYEGGAMEVAESGKNRGVLRITEFDGPMRKINEQTISGYICRAIELTGYSKVKVEIGQAISKGDKYTDFIFTWE